MAHTSVYIVEFTDEICHAHTLEGWAEWLHENAEDDGPGREIKDGESFEVYVTDRQYFDVTIDPTAETVELPDALIEAVNADEGAYLAIAFGEGLGWTEDDVFETLDALKDELLTRADSDGETFSVVVSLDRDGTHTVTYTLIDGEPVLQPDGWSL